MSLYPKYSTLFVISCCAATILSVEVDAQPATFTIDGASDELSRNIRSHVVIPNVDCAATQRRLGRFTNGINDRVIRAGRALGYYNLVATVSFSIDSECWSLNIDIAPGDSIEISAVDVQIRQDSRLFTRVLDELPVAVGDQLNQANYERIKTNLSTRAIEVGFFSARFERAQLLVDLQSNLAAVAIDFDPGERYRFGAAQIEPLESLSDDFIRRFVSFDENAFYSSAALIELRNSLSDSQYFSDVTVTPALESVQDGAVPVQIGLRVRPQEAYSVGAGVTTDIGPRMSFNYENRYLNPNGHRVDVGARASPIEQELDINYVIPWTKPATENLRFSGGFLNEDNDSFENESLKLSSVYSFINGSQWRQSIFTSFQHDDYLINDENDVSDILLAGVSLAKTRADDALYPYRGWRLFGQVRGASSDILSTETFLQFNLNGKLITPLGTGRLLSRFEIGTTLADEASNLPPTILYFTGGDQSVRGYKYQSLGPESEQGEVLGGKHQLVAGVEYDFNVSPNWKLAVFADAGNAFSSFDDFELKTSVGLGIRWLSPIGPIRVDLASALDDDNKLRLHIAMGPDL
ncbi:MAG: translocation and assembly module TamA [Pseudohongiellaceae bacterium]